MRELPDFLTVREVAEIFRISPTTAYKEVQRFLDTGGREGIPVLLIGGQKRIPRQKLEPLAGGPIHLPAVKSALSVGLQEVQLGFGQGAASSSEARGRSSSSPSPSNAAGSPPPNSMSFCGQAARRWLRCHCGGGRCRGPRGGSS